MKKEKEKIKPNKSEAVGKKKLEGAFPGIVDIIERANKLVDDARNVKVTLVVSIAPTGHGYEPKVAATASIMEMEGHIVSMINHRNSIKEKLRKPGGCGLKDCVACNP